MASEAGYGSEGLSQDAFVEKLMPDPAQSVPPMAGLEGLLGRSSREGYWRLYVTSELNDYVEFKNGDVLNSESIPKEQSALGLESTRIWLRRDAEIERVRSWWEQASKIMAGDAHSVYSPHILQREPVVARRAAAGGGRLTYVRSHVRRVARRNDQGQTVLCDELCSVYQGEGGGEVEVCDEIEGSCTPPITERSGATISR